jgi:Zn-dependent peptidase ImmA (M78 family)
MKIKIDPAIKDRVKNFIAANGRNCSELLSEFSSAIRCAVGEILLSDAIDFMKDPKNHVKVYIRTIVTNYGYTIIDDSNMGNTHAILDRSTKMIRLNAFDTEEEKRFSLAHEFGHIIFDVNENDNHVLTDSDSQQNKEVARGAMENSSYTLSDICYGQANSHNPFSEEVMDYFAANLLLPIERFFFRSDGSTEEIAKAFGVSEKCVAKRGKEIQQYVQSMTVPHPAIDPNNITVMTQEEIDEALLAY